MESESIDKVKVSIIEGLKKIGDIPYLTFKETTYTGNQLAKEIDEETEFGLLFISRAILLTIDLIARSKIKADE
jgi:hypothetical protein